MTRLTDTMIKQLPSKLPATYWVDSIATLCWIKNNWPLSMCQGEWMKYDQCLLVLSGDIALELSIQQIFPHADWRLRSYWIGPPFLKLSKIERPTLYDPPFDDVACSELLKTPRSETHVLATVVSAVPPINLEHFMNWKDYSSLNCLLRVTAWVLCFFWNWEGVNPWVPSVFYTYTVTAW